MQLAVDPWDESLDLTVAHTPSGLCPQAGAEPEPLSPGGGIVLGMTVLDRRSTSLVLDQCGALATAQAVELFGRSRVRSKVSSDRWQRPTRGVVVMHNGPLTDAQRDWVALLSCPRNSALAGRTALGWDGFTGLDEPHPHVVLPSGCNRPRHGDVVPHFSTMLDERDLHPLRQPRRTRTARSLVDFASWQSNPRRARVIVLSGVQQGLTSTRHLREALTRRGPCRHRALIIESILDAWGGIQSLPERDFDQLRASRGLPRPTRQAIMRRRDGRPTSCARTRSPLRGRASWPSPRMRSDENKMSSPINSCACCGVAAGTADAGTDL